MIDSTEINDKGIEELLLIISITSDEHKMTFVNYLRILVIKRKLKP